MYNYNSFRIPINSIPDYWSEIVPYISQALKYSAREWTPIEILKLALDDKIQIWLTVEASKENPNKIICVTTTMILTFKSGKKILHILTMSGSGLKKFLSQDQILYNFAVEKGLDAIRSEGRKGWDRFTNNKYEQIYHVYERKINLEKGD